jgi:spore maturation protein CgeB
MLEAASEVVDLNIFGYGSGLLPQRLSRLHKGEVWGKNMYRVLARSLVTLNRHIDVAGAFANNMRLYEATGMGACLMTDRKDNLHELFEIDHEVVCYSSLGELKDKLAYLVSHPEKAIEIGKNGQRRTLRDHGYDTRMRELKELIGRYFP